MPSPPPAVVSWWRERDLPRRSSAAMCVLPRCLQKSGSLAPAAEVMRPSADKQFGKDKNRWRVPAAEAAEKSENGETACAVPVPRRRANSRLQRACSLAGGGGERDRRDAVFERGVGHRDDNFIRGRSVGLDDNRTPFFLRGLQQRFQLLQRHFLIAEINRSVCARR